MFSVLPCNWEIFISPGNSSAPEYSAVSCCANLEAALVAWFKSVEVLEAGPRWHGWRIVVEGEEGVGK